MPAPAASRPTRTARPCLRRLEDRLAPAATALPRTVNAGDWYSASGGRVELHRRVDQLAVRFDDTAAIDRLTADGGPLAGLTVAAWADATTALFAPPRLPGQREPAYVPALSRADRIAADPAVDWVVPVFTDASGSAQLIATDQLVVALTDPADAAAVFGSAREFAAYRPAWGTPDQFVVTLADTFGPAALQAAHDLTADGRVRWASPDFRAAARPANLNDEFLGDQWHLNNTGQGGGIAGADVGAFSAWNLSSGKNVTIAVLDDGVELSHPDLAGNIFVNAGEVPGNGIDDDGNGWIDDRSGYDFASNDNNANPLTVDDNHGTAVAGVAAAVGDNTIGVAGLAYQAKILPVRLYGSNPDGSVNLPAASDIAAGIYYAAGRTKSGGGTWAAGAVLNLSFTVDAPTTAVTDAVTWAVTQGRGGKGAVVTAAAGNGFGSAVSYPANLSANLAGVVAVGASEDFDFRAFYSNFGPELDVIAPADGGNRGILTTDRTGADGYDSSSDYFEVSQFNFGGTSFAAALVSATAALVLQRDPTLTASAVRGLVRNTTDMVGPFTYDATGFNPEYGYGRIDAGTAVKGVGVAEVQLLDGAAEVPDATGKVEITAQLGSPLTRTLRVRNQGTLPLTLGPAMLSPGPVTIAKGFADTTLTAGESTTLVLSLDPTEPGTAAQTLTFSTNDPDEGSYEVQVNSASLNPSISGFFYEDRDGDGNFDFTDPSVFGQAAYIDANNNAKFDSTPTTYTSADVPVTIDGSKLHVSSVNISGFNGPLVDVALKFSIDHTYNADVTAYLVNPAGTKIFLFGGVGGDGQNFTDTVLSDAAAAPIAAGTAPFTGAFRPVEPLATFVNGPANGTWQLQIEDTFSFADDGKLLSWSLTLSTGEAVAPSDFGYYVFNNLDAGTYRVRWREQAAYNLGAQPAGGAHLVTVASKTDQRFGNDFALLQPDTVYGRFYEDATNNGVYDAGEPDLANWTAYLDLDGNGVLTNKASTFAASGLPLTIDGSAPHQSNITVAGLSGTVTDVNVKLNVTHPNLEELAAFLIGPTGEVVTLFGGFAGSLTGANLTDTVFDDQAAQPITAGTAPYTGSFRPDTTLADFDGTAPNGTWTLEIVDFDDTVNSGALTAWSITVTVQEPTTTSDFGGIYTFTLSPGPYSIRRVLEPDFTATGPAGGAHAVTLAAGQSVTGRDFGQLRGNTVYGKFYDDADKSGSPSAGEFGLFGFTAYADRNGNGQFDQSTKTLAAPGLPLPIDDFAVTKSAVTVAGQTDRVAGVAVKLNIAHPATGELTLTLTGPTGQTVLLAANVGGTGDDFTDTVFTDSAATPIFFGTPPFTGAFLPFQSLSVFNGTDPNGDWTLSVSDFGFDNTGTLLSWSLDLTLAEPFGTSNFGGFYTIPALATGPVDIRAARPANWVGTQPAGGQYSVNVPAGAAVTGRDFGQYFVPPPPPTAKVAVNGAAAVQRSMVTSLVVTFSEPVSYLGSPDQVFKLQRTGPGAPQDVAVAVTANSTAATVTFTGGPVELPQNTLADGRYALTVNASLVLGNGGFLDGNGDGTGGDNLVFNTHRLYGDGSGDAAVNFTDFLQFRGTFGLSSGHPGFLDYFDKNGDAAVNFTDFLAFRSRFGTTLP